MSPPTMSFYVGPIALESISKMSREFEKLYRNRPNRSVSAVILLKKFQIFHIDYDIVRSQATDL